MRQTKVLTTAFIIVCSSAFIAESAVPFQKRVYQVPICASSQEALKQVKSDLELTPKDLRQISNYLKNALQSGKLISAQKLLNELQSQYHKGKNSADEAVLQPLEARIERLQSAISGNQDRLSHVFQPEISDISGLTQNQTTEFNIDEQRKLCNGGMLNAKNPFDVYEFSLP